jgi:short-subunit dehydrogenase
LDAIINNAGLLVKKTFSGLLAEDARKMFDINVIVPGILIKTFLSFLKKSPHPHIINIGSMVVYRAVPNSRVFIITVRPRGFGHTDRMPCRRIKT